MKLVFVLLIISSTCLAQRIVLTGVVSDHKTKEPLSFATIGVKGKPEQTISTSNGQFSLTVPSSYQKDTLMVTYLGYVPFFKSIASLQSGEKIYLDESYTMLDEVVVTQADLNIRKLEKDLRPIRGNLYAMETEVTNRQYNLFLAFLQEQNQTEKRKQYNYDLTSYDKASQDFFRRYVTQYKTKSVQKDSIAVPHIGPHEWSDYPAVNVPYAGAQAYCEWLTLQYNTYTGKKKYKRVTFRMPSLKEWQIMALGYKKFQTWDLKDNMVEVIVSDDSLEITPRKGQRKTIQVSDDILYPWFGSWYYRRSPRNHKGCFLGNFRIDSVENPCRVDLPAYDGWTMMSRTASYFPNDMGFYDVVGNVAEMIDEEGKACGGSWNDPPLESTIHSIKTYKTPNATVGFRVFMEVVE